MITKSNNKPLVSVITPTKNRAEFLINNLNSVRNQSYPRIEHIVIDGNSDDDTVEILKRYEKLCNLKWISEKDKCHAEAYNKGILMVHGDIVSFLNSDDMYLLDAVEKVVNEFLNYPKTDIIYGNLLYINKILGKEIPRNFRETNLRKLLFSEGFLPQQTLFYSKKIIDKVGLMDVKYKYVPEKSWWFRMFRLNPSYRYLDQLITKATLHKGSISIKDRKKQYEEIKRVYLDYGISRFSKLYLNYIIGRYFYRPMYFAQNNFPTFYKYLKWVKKKLI